jgi:hypothetical protein
MHTAATTEGMDAQVSPMMLVSPLLLTSTELLQNASATAAAKSSPPSSSNHAHAEPLVPGTAKEASSSTSSSAPGASVVSSQPIPLPPTTLQIPAAAGAGASVLARALVFGPSPKLAGRVGPRIDGEEMDLRRKRALSLENMHELEEMGVGSGRTGEGARKGGQEGSASSSSSSLPHAPRAIPAIVSSSFLSSMATKAVGSGLRLSFGGVSRVTAGTAASSSSSYLPAASAAAAGNSAKDSEAQAPKRDPLLPSQRQSAGEAAVVFPGTVTPAEQRQPARRLRARLEYKPEEEEAEEAEEEVAQASSSAPALTPLMKPLQNGVVSSSSFAGATPGPRAILPPPPPPTSINSLSLRRPQAVSPYLSGPPPAGFTPVRAAAPARAFGSGKGFGVPRFPRPGMHGNASGSASSSGGGGGGGGAMGSSTSSSFHHHGGSVPVSGRRSVHHLSFHPISGLTSGTTPSAFMRPSSESSLHTQSAKKPSTIAEEEVEGARSKGASGKEHFGEGEDDENPGTSVPAPVPVVIADNRIVTKALEAAELMRATARLQAAVGGGGGGGGGLTGIATSSAHPESVGAGMYTAYNASDMLASSMRSSAAIHRHALVGGVGGGGAASHHPAAAPMNMTLAGAKTRALSSKLQALMQVVSAVGKNSPSMPLPYKAQRVPASSSSGSGGGGVEFDGRILPVDVETGCVPFHAIVAARVETLRGPLRDIQLMLEMSPHNEDVARAEYTTLIAEYRKSKHQLARLRAASVGGE